MWLPKLMITGINWPVSWVASANWWRTPSHHIPLVLPIVCQILIPIQLRRTFSFSHFPPSGNEVPWRSIIKHRINTTEWAAFRKIRKMAIYGDMPDTRWCPSSESLSWCK
jgi:hypothetical protein